jgi:hypothetical protein
MNAPIAQGKLTPDDQLSASQLAALAGASPWETPNDILTRVTNGVMGKPREPLVSEAADWGTALEGLVATKAMEKLGLTDYQLDHSQAYQHPVLPLACSIDSTAEGQGKVVHHDPDNGIYVMNDSGSIALEWYRRGRDQDHGHRASGESTVIHGADPAAGTDGYLGMQVGCRGHPVPRQQA